MRLLVEFILFVFCGIIMYVDLWDSCRKEKDKYWRNYLILRTAVFALIMIVTFVVILLHYMGGGR